MLNRDVLWQELPQTEWDIIVVGGGITGAGVAREAARAGAKVLLIDQKDYAFGTSSRSSKMVHGGLRYIAMGDIKLTRHSLVERERLLREAPGLVDRMSYFFAHYQGGGIKSNRWAFAILLMAYDILAGIKDRSYFNAKKFLARVPNYRSDKLLGASRYTDAVTDDTRLVIRVLDEACKDGAVTVNYVKAEKTIITNDQVTALVVRDELSQETATLKAKVVVNATGAWVNRLRQEVATETVSVRPQRGSHLVVSAERLPLNDALILFHPDDNRAMFIYTWEGRTVIGTTDLDHKDNLDDEAVITAEEVKYLLRAANHEFPQAKLTPNDVIATFSGVRPIVSSGKGLDPSKERRDHAVWADKGVISVSGGKLTTFRQIAQDVLTAAESWLPTIKQRDQKASVFSKPEGHISSPLSPDQYRRFVGKYGYLAQRFLAEMPAQELKLIPETQTMWAEVRWALRYEQVVHLDDLMLRRTRLGLLLVKGGAAHFDTIKQMALSEGWTEERWVSEQARYSQIWQAYYSLPKL
ncbi:MAG TPA: glycerol-3-phosphate dehydrogenase/oxidase [Agitococcus sp.]|nr:glycerol-3-phosphate dehydrogenase/oxidase [Agitococcus sp.]HMV59577.1 glycerol-3-phosphate dehydrogenase/oxidase [Agitococcus sp.]HMX98173.1 glycerol-3-phosphate dehydrogenase/oxidase [Agitococcus sp.]HMY27443.1 glycerol-3-phosphate dehydrogenase/oxidase [Agitococcus sp.]HMY81205.1 glycerol-3-phosphate dehydrogenase/oxidase [Agitococcus sp.]